MPCLHSQFEVIDQYQGVLLQCVACKRMFQSYEQLKKARQYNVASMQEMSKTE